MSPSSNVTHALNIVVKGIAILYFLFCQTSVLLVEQIMHAIYYIYIDISIIASRICYNDIGCFSNVLPYINARGKLPLSPFFIMFLYFHSSCYIHTIFSDRLRAPSWSHGFLPQWRTITTWMSC